jgi:hypothetical protein
MENTLWKVGLLCGAWFWAACSGGATAAGGSGDAGSDSSLAEAGACEPEGAWQVSYASDAGAPPAESIQVARAGMGLDVAFTDREPPQDRCLPDAGPGTASVTADFDETSCTLEATWSTSWCESGEQQCERFTLVLRFGGDAASGTATREGGWCSDKRLSEYVATAARLTR